MNRLAATIAAEGFAFEHGEATRALFGAMADWAAFCAKPAAEVVPMQGTGRAGAR